MSPQDGCELGLSRERANLQDGRISAGIEAAVLREVDGSWRPCGDIWGATSSWLAWQQQTDGQCAPMEVDPLPSAHLPLVDPPPWALLCCQAGPPPWARCHEPLPAAASSLKVAAPSPPWKSEEIKCISHGETVWGSFLRLCQLRDCR